MINKLKNKNTKLLNIKFDQNQVKKKLGQIINSSVEQDEIKTINSKIKHETSNIYLKKIHIDLDIVIDKYSDFRVMTDRDENFRQYFIREDS